MQGWQVFVEIPGKPPVELSEGEALVGRSRNCALHVPESTVSRQHAKILVAAGGQVTVQDLGSSNGTFVNGEKVEGQRAIANGDRVIVGEAEMTVRILPPIEAAEATMKVSIPPMAAPAPGATQHLAEGLPIPPPPLVAAAAAPNPGVTVVHAQAPPPPPAPAPAAPPPPPPPPMTAAPTRPAAPPMPSFDPPLQRTPTPTPPAPAPPKPAFAAAPAAAAAAGPAPKSPDLLSSIQEIEKMPLPPPAAKKGGSAVPAGVTVQVDPAGFWIRVAANLIDGVLFGVVFGVLFVVGFAAAFVLPAELAILISSLLSIAGSLGLMFLFYFYYPALKGQTPGKKLLGLWIYSDETPPGHGLGWSKAFLRFVGHVVCSFTASIGYVLVAFTSKKQGLHDLIAKTYVGKKR